MSIYLKGYINVKLNGKNEYVIANTSLSQFLRSHKFDLEWLVVEHNNRIVRPELWTYVELRNDDRVEVLTFSGEGI